MQFLQSYFASILYRSLLQLSQQVHGGISEDDVVKFISMAQKQATENKKHGLDTVVFFDEANTTDAIGLISEIMCDRTIYGKRIPEDLKFIAAYHT